MQLKLPYNPKKYILPGLFVVYLAGTMIAFLVDAQYFNATLTKTFAPPTLPEQITIDLPAIRRVAAIIGLDEALITALTTSRTQTQETSPPVENPAPEKNVETPTAENVAPTTTSLQDRSAPQVVQPVAPSTSSPTTSTEAATNSGTSSRVLPSQRTK